MPNIPAVSPTININRGQVVNLLLASIAFEELGLAHVINAEAEKLQAVLGTLRGTHPTATSISQLLTVNRSVNRTLQTVLKTQMLLQFKLEDVLDIPEGHHSHTHTHTHSPHSHTDTPIPLPQHTPAPPPPPPTIHPCPANITMEAAENILATGDITTLFGKVTDASGHPVPNVKVIVTTDAGLVIPPIDTTDMNGDFSTTFKALDSTGGVVVFAAVAGTTIAAATNLIIS